MNARNLALGVTVTIVVSLLLLAATEVGLSILNIPTYSTYHALYRTPHPVWNHGFIPNTTARMITPEYDITLSINSLGMRSPEPETPKKRFRILMLGDSFTEGVGVNWSQSFGGRLQDILVSKGYDVEVLSAGVLSHSPILEWLFLQHHGPKIKPDIVLLNLDLSDVFDDYRYEQEAERDASGIIVAVPGARTPPSWRNTITYFCDQYRINTCTLLIHLYVNIRRNLLGFRPPIIVGNITSDRFFLVRDNQSETYVNPHYQRTFGYISKTKESAESIHSAFALVLYPYGFQVNEREWAGGRYFWYLDDKPVYSLDVFDRFKEYGARANITVIDTSYKFNNITEFPLYFPMDGHFNARGYRLAAEGMAEQLLTDATLGPLLKKSLNVSLRLT